MMPIQNDTSRRTAARVAGTGYLALFFLAIFANFVVKEGLIDFADPDATVAAVRENETLFRFGIAAFAVVFLLDIAVAWGVYVLFAPGGRTRSLLVAWFRLAYTLLLGVSTVFLFLGLQIATGTTALNSDVALLMFSAFDFAWNIGLAAFGVHVFLLGTLIFRSKIAPRLIGMMLCLAGCAYLVDTFLRMLLSDYLPVAGTMIVVVAVPAVIAELTFTVWLLLAGRASSTVTRFEDTSPTA